MVDRVSKLRKSARCKSGDKNHLGGEYEAGDKMTRSYEWIVRSNRGSGSRASSDPARGHCVHVLDKLFLQNNLKNKRWLSGGRGEHHQDVRTLMFFNDITDLIWTIRRTPGDGQLTDGTTFGDRVSQG